MSGAFLVFRDPHRATLAAAGLETLAALLDSSHGEVEKASVPGREVRKVSLAGQHYFLKRIRGRGAGEIQHEARVLDHLGSQGLPVPEVCAMGRNRDGAVLVTVGLPVTTSLEQRLINGSVTPAEINKLTDRVAHLVRRLHESGVNHRDLYLGHVLLDAKDQPFLVDLGRAEIRRRVPRRRLIKDLAALDFSTPERVVGPRIRLRFIRRYLGPGSSDRRVRNLLAAIRRKSVRIRRHVARKVARGDANVHVNT